MRSWKFPKMFNTNNANIWLESEYLEATKQNAKLVLNIERGELYGDPYFGLLLKHYMFNQNSYVLRDIIIDMIYSQLVLFIPQLYIKRQDIEIIRDNQKGKLTCRFSGVSQIDYTLNTFNLTLLTEQSD